MEKKYTGLVKLNMADRAITLTALILLSQVKTGEFAEHSNQLWNISGVPLWSKVNSGLFKMYKVEVGYPKDC